jgi:hypothetical protein
MVLKRATPALVKEAEAAEKKEFENLRLPAHPGIP